MKVEQPRQHDFALRAMPAMLRLTAAGCLAGLALSCGSSSDSGPASGGTSHGGSTSASGGTSAGGNPGSGSGNVGGSADQTVDCAAVCGHVKSLCAENNAISDTWVSACKSACDARVQLTPDVAELEQACVMAAADCSAAISCVASPH